MIKKDSNLYAKEREALYAKDSKTGLKRGRKCGGEDKCRPYIMVEMTEACSMNTYSRLVTP